MKGGSVDLVLWSLLDSILAFGCLIVAPKRVFGLELERDVEDALKVILLLFSALRSSLFYGLHFRNLNSGNMGDSYLWFAGYSMGFLIVGTVVLHGVILLFGAPFMM